MRERLGPVDALRALACVLIVWHHLAFYGPMSDVVRPFAPGLIDALYAHARMAVQVFLVVSGFLLARGVLPGQVPAVPWTAQVGRRYVRLLVPYAAALVLAILTAEAVRAGGGHPAASGNPTWTQLAAHLLMLQDLVGEEALSAGVWYVAIDLQLFALATALSALAAHRPRLLVGSVAALTAASLLVLNCDARLDATALYFFGAYGLGMLAAWAAGSARPLRWLAAVALLGALALVVDWRGRIALAWVTALGLGALQAAGAMAWQPPRWVAWLSRVSYPVFLVHFSVLLAVGTLWGRWFPTGPVVNAAGMVLAFVLSLGAGALLHRLEQGAMGPRTALGWQVAVLAVGMVAMGV